MTPEDGSVAAAGGRRKFWRVAAWVLGVPVALLAVNLTTQPESATPAPPPGPTTVPATSTSTAAPTTVPPVEMPVPEQAPTVDTGPILATARVFVAGWLASTPDRVAQGPAEWTPEELEQRKTWLEPVTAPALLKPVVNIPPGVLPAGPAADIAIESADENRAVVRVTMPSGAAVVELQSTALGWRVSGLDKG